MGAQQGAAGPANQLSVSWPGALGQDRTGCYLNLRRLHREAESAPVGLQLVTGHLGHLIITLQG
jgi:hypothetical protein